MEKKKIQRYRGIRRADLVNVCEGDGSPEFPMNKVDYVCVHEIVAGVSRLKTIGKVVALTEEERDWFGW